MISVIVPVHNVEKYLNRCVNSIMNNTYKDIEVLLIENGSNDLSWEICREYDELYDNIHSYSLQETGVSHARNFGLKEAKGDYITFVDADDYISPIMFEQMSFALSTNTDMILCELCVGEEKNYIFDNKSNRGEFRVLSIDEFLYGYLIKEKLSYVGVYCKLIRRDKLKGIIFDEKISFGEDVKFIFQMALQMKSVAYTCMPLYYYYRGNENSICRNYNKKEREKGFLQFPQFRKLAEKNFRDPLIDEYVNAFLFRKSLLVLRENQWIRSERLRVAYDEEKRKSLKKIWGSHKMKKKDKYSILMEYYFPNLKTKISRAIRK